MFLGYGENGNIVKIKEFYNPDSLCGMYAALTDYLGFEILDGEFKVMGIAPYGDPVKYDLSQLAHFSGKEFKVNNNHKPYYARLFMVDNEQYNGFFRTKEMHPDVNLWVAGLLNKNKQLELTL